MDANKLKEMAKKEGMTEEEVEDMMEEANEGEFELILRKPFTYEEKVYSSLHFDFDTLTGRDCIMAQRELENKGTMLTVRMFSLPYLAALAVRACKEPVGTDLIEALPIRDFEKLTSKVQRFLSMRG